MQLARVIGSLVSTHKVEALRCVKLLIVQPLRRDLTPKGEPVVAADGTAMAGPGELVTIVGSREAAQALEEPYVPVDHAIVGLVDRLDELDELDDLDEDARR